MRYGFGIDVGGTTVKLAFLDENGTMKDKWEIPTRTEDGGKNVLPDIAASVKEYMEKENLRGDQIIGIGKVSWALRGGMRLLREPMPCLQPVQVLQNTARSLPVLRNIHRPSSERNRIHFSQTVRL